MGKNVVSDSATPWKINVQGFHAMTSPREQVKHTCTTVAQHEQVSAVAKWQRNTQINGTLQLMNDKANCGNGLLLFGLDKYSDKWSALIIPSVFVPERRRRRLTRDACRMRQAN